MAARDVALEERYRSLFVIGRGGMGTVEAALELGDGPAKRVVALKRLLPDSARDGRRAEMFLREAKLAAMLHHPNVVRAFDYGEIDGELFLAMEYVEGQPLSRILRTLADAKAELPPSLVAHVLAEVCEGLHAAHELAGDDGQALQLVHRDVSPQNVMVGYDGHVRLLDFGVAKIEAESVTKTGEVKGKTAYMSPEQAMGDAIDRRSDLFGVGAVLYECLTNQRMWGDGTDMDVIRKLALEKPPPLERGDDAMRALYTRLVARDAKDRPATAHEVAQSLRALCPEGGEAATTALRDILQKRFGDQVEEQRKKLEGSLEEAAPDQANALRESVLPDFSERASAPAVEPRVAEAPRSRTSMYAGLAIVGVLAIIAWRVAGASPDVPKPPPIIPTVTTATVTTPPATTTSAPPIASTPPAIASSVTTTPPPPSAKIPVVATRVTAQPTVDSAKKPDPPVPTKTPPPPATSAPLNVDPNPL